MKKLMNGRVVVNTGDITRFEGDAVVNAANSSLLGGGGVDGAIHRAGGPEILDECKKIRNTDYPEGLPAGEAVITTAGKLPARYVIHTVGPVWHGGGSDEDETLAKAYRNSLELAFDKGLESIAFPAISTGIYGFPKERAARIAYREIESFLESRDKPRQVTLMFFSEGDYDTFLKAVEEM
jgi:O-acetyl-ADP-ribose deacetylase (regulator of RNase III)